MTEPHLLAVDGGGTSTTAWITNRAGRVLGRGAAGPANAKLVGLNRARANLHDAIANAFLNAGQGVQPPAEIACFGLAGFDRPDDQHVIGSWSESVRWSRRMMLVNDGDMVLAAGTPQGYGIGLIAATGSIAVGRNLAGSTARAGGWGHLIGDEGGAYSVALAALRRIARTADGREPQPAGSGDPLTRRVCEALGLTEPSGLVSLIYSRSFDPARIASLAPTVVAAAEEDPTITDRILIPAGRELARCVAAVTRTLGGPIAFPRPIPLAISGSFLLSAKHVMRALLDQLANWKIPVSASVVAEPVIGALILAQRTMEGESPRTWIRSELEETVVL